MFISIGLGVVIAVALIVAVSILTGGKVTGGNTPKSALVGTHIKSFSLDGLSGGEEKSPWSSGHASVLIFFASWCGPCQKEMPKVAAYVAAHDPSPVVVLGMDSSDQRGPAEAFIKKDKVTFPVAFDALGQVASGDFGFQSVPETVFLNDKGVVTDVHYGAIPVKGLRAGIKSLQSA